MMDLKDNKAPVFDFEALCREAGDAVQKSRPSCFLGLWHSWGQWETGKTAQWRACAGCAKIQTRKLPSYATNCDHHWHTLAVFDVVKGGVFQHEAYRQACCHCGEFVYREPASTR